MSKQDCVKRLDAANRDRDAKRAHEKNKARNTWEEIGAVGSNVENGFDVCSGKHFLVCSICHTAQIQPIPIHLKTAAETNKKYL